MTDFVTGETFQTIMGGVIVLFLIAPAIKMGPLRFLGEMLVNLVFKVLFLAVAFGILITLVFVYLWRSRDDTTADGHTTSSKQHHHHKPHGFHSLRFIDAGVLGKSSPRNKAAPAVEEVEEHEIIFEEDKVSIRFSTK